MAAAHHAARPELVELRNISADDLEPVLEEERLAWQTLLRWDFTASAELVRRFVRIHALSGFALVEDGRPVGYSYYVCEDRKGLVGDLFVQREYATPENEHHLLAASLEQLVAAPQTQRIEAQLMMMRGPSERPVPMASQAHAFPRVFMLAELDDAPRLPAGAAPIRLTPWSETRQEEAAMLISRSYEGHVDSYINDQYRSYGGARRFLSNIIQYPGCGSFAPSASYFAEQADGKLCGLVLASRVAADTGHITQVCVAPEWKGRGAGYELMRAAMTSLAGMSCERVSLTVTASNTGAIGLYQRLGFRATRRFAAYVWEGF